MRAARLPARARLRPDARRLGASRPRAGRPAPADQASPPASSGDGASAERPGIRVDQPGQGGGGGADPAPRPSTPIPEGTTDPNYAYALYNLGNALRLSGIPRRRSRCSSGACSIAQPALHRGCGACARPRRGRRRADPHHGVLGPTGGRGALPFWHGHRHSIRRRGLRRGEGRLAPARAREPGREGRLPARPGGPDRGERRRRCSRRTRGRRGRARGGAQRGAARPADADRGADRRDGGGRARDRRTSTTRSAR